MRLCGWIRSLHSLFPPLKNAHSSQSAYPSQARRAVLSEKRLPATATPHPSRPRSGASHHREAISARTICSASRSPSKWTTSPSTRHQASAIAPSVPRPAHPRGAPTCHQEAPPVRSAPRPARLRLGPSLGIRPATLAPSPRTRSSQGLYILVWHRQDSNTTQRTTQGK